MHWKQLPIDRNYLDDGYSLDETINLNVFLAKDGNFEYFYVLVWLSLFFKVGTEKKEKSHSQR